jgi:hypothetical protein
MPGYLVHLGATVLCAHTGQAKPSSTSPRVTVGGQQIATMPIPYLVSACTLPSSAGGPCVTAQWTTAATRIVSAGQAVVLADSQATCAPTGTPLQIAQTQTRVTGT